MSFVPRNRKIKESCGEQPILEEVTRLNRSLLKHYVVLVDFLSRILGPDYEIALHDLSGGENSIVALANGHISGRTLGSPLSAAVLQSLFQESAGASDFRINYSGLSIGNKKLRSSSLFLKDAAGKLEGLLCVNFDDSRYQELSAAVLRLCHPDAYVARNIVIRDDLLGAEPLESGEDGATLTDVARSVVQEVLEESDLPADRMTQADKLRLVALLYQRGVFHLKGAVPYVSQALRCSPATVYRYLGRVKAGQEA